MKKAPSYKNSVAVSVAQQAISVDRFYRNLEPKYRYTSALDSTFILTDLMSCYDQRAFNLLPKTNPRQNIS